MYPAEQPPTPEQVRKFRGATKPAAGEKRILHSFAGDVPPNPDLRHGVVTKTSLEVNTNEMLHHHAFVCVTISTYPLFSETRSDSYKSISMHTREHT